MGLSPFVSSTKDPETPQRTGSFGGRLRFQATCSRLDKSPSLANHKPMAPLSSVGTVLPSKLSPVCPSMKPSCQASLLADPLPPEWGSHQFSELKL